MIREADSSLPTGGKKMCMQIHHENSEIVPINGRRKENTAVKEKKIFHEVKQNSNRRDR